MIKGSITYDGIKMILYNSPEYNSIGAEYEESIPLFYMKETIPYVLFLYYYIEEDKITIAYSILINRLNGDLKMYGGFDMLDYLNLSSNIYEALSDYTNYYKNRQEYEEIFKYVNDSSELNTGRMLLANAKLSILQQSILGEDLYNHIC